MAVDLDAATLAWGLEHNVGSLKKSAAKRIQLMQEDVMRVRTDPMDIVLAMNFSYQLFKDDKTLRKYFRRVRESLVDDGVFFLDAYGGYDSYREIKEATEFKGFTYVWDQASYNPINGDMRCHIHFRFPDGSRMKRAFTYDWRLWTLPEIQRLLKEAGFSRVTVYWEGTDKDGEPNGVYKPSRKGDLAPAWVAYLVAFK